VSELRFVLGIRICRALLACLFAFQHLISWQLFDWLIFHAERRLLFTISVCFVKANVPHQELLRNYASHFSPFASTLFQFVQHWLSVSCSNCILLSIFQHSNAFEAATQIRFHWQVHGSHRGALGKCNPTHYSTLNAFSPAGAYIEMIYEMMCEKEETEKLRINLSNTQIPLAHNTFPFGKSTLLFMLNK